MPQFYSRRQAAFYCGRCPKTLRKLAQQALGPPLVLIGARPAYSVEALELWLAAGGDA